MAHFFISRRETDISRREILIPNREMSISRREMKKYGCCSCFSCYIFISLQGIAKHLFTYTSKSGNMAKYIKQEMADMRGEGQTKAYYRMQTIRNIGMDEFIEIMTRRGGLTRGTAISALTHAMETLGELMGMGYTVSIDGLGTFKATLGLRRDKEMDSLDGTEPKRNAQSLCVNGVNFKADKQLIRQTGIHCQLERGHVSRLRQSPYTREERLERALNFIEENGFMRLSDYVKLTGLSRSTACRELKEFRTNPNNGLTTQGRGSSSVYVRRIKEISDEK